MSRVATDDRGADDFLRYQELFDFAPEGYVLTDSAGLIQQANHAAAALLKTRRDFLLGKPIALFISEPERSLVYSHLTRLSGVASDSVAEWDVWLRPNRASPIAVNLNVTVVADQSGAQRVLRWRLRDITAHLRAERALHAEKSLADALIDAAQAAILVLDTEGRVLRSNPFAQQTLGHSEGELRGRDWILLLPSEVRGEATALPKACLELRVGREFTSKTLGKDGLQRIVAWSAKALTVQEDNPASVVVVGYDVTELQAAQAKAVQSARLAAIGEVTASLTHESRNVLQRARSCLDRLHWRVGDSPELSDLVVRATQAIMEMTSLFEDVRGYAAPILLDVINCHLGEVWREAWAQSMAGGEWPHVKFSQDAEPELWVRGDPERLTRVFRNLFDNAAQACGDGGHVEVICREGNLTGRPALRVHVRDNGPGLGDAQAHLFEAFFTTKSRGTGLGLAIARRIVEAHGGQLAAANHAGGGAEFTLFLPRSQS